MTVNGVEWTRGVMLKFTDSDGSFRIVYPIWWRFVYVLFPGMIPPIHPRSPSAQLTRSNAQIEHERIVTE